MNAENKEILRSEVRRKSGNNFIIEKGNHLVKYFFSIKSGGYGKLCNSLRELQSGGLMEPTQFLKEIE